MTNYIAGKVILLNSKKWGFISYDKSSKLLKIFSIEDNEVRCRAIEPDALDKIYANAVEGEICEEAIKINSHVLNLNKMLESLKPGTMFIGNDNEKYMYLNAKKGKICFAKGKEEYTAGSGFIKEITNEISDKYLDFLSPVKTKKAYKALSDFEKVNVATNYAKCCFAGDDIIFEIIELGNIITGIAYYHEVDKYYELIGLQIKYKCKFHFEEESKVSVGFFPIYSGKHPDYYPLSFEDSHSNYNFDESTYENGCGDSIVNNGILIKKEKLQKYFDLTL